MKKSTEMPSEAQAGLGPRCGKVGAWPNFLTFLFTLPYFKEVSIAATILPTIPSCLYGIKDSNPYSPNMNLIPFYSDNHINNYIVIRSIFKNF